MANHQKGSDVRATINALANETLNSIVEYILVADEGVSTATSLAQTNYRFRCIVARQRYAASAYDTEHLHDFLRVIVLNDAVARCVRSLQIDHIAPRVDDPSHSDRRAIRRGLAARKMPHWKKLANSCNDQNPDALLAAILMHTPNLEVLTIAKSIEAHMWIKILNLAANRNNLGQGVDLSKLRAVHILQEVDIHVIWPVLQLPSLRTLTISDSLKPDDPLIPIKKVNPWPSRTAVSAVEQLTVLGCVIDGVKLAKLLDYCRSLKQLTYTWRHSKEHSVGTSRIRRKNSSTIGFSCFQVHVPTLENPSPFITALRRHKHSLEALRMCNFTHEDAESDQGLSLNDFERLKKLEIGLSMVLRPTDQRFTQNLPSNLKTLHLTVTDMDTSTNQELEEEKNEENKEEKKGGKKEGKKEGDDKGIDYDLALENFSRYDRNDLPELTKFILHITRSQELGLKQHTWETVRDRLALKGAEASSRRSFTISTAHSLLSAANLCL
ncbi:hypothetical protein BDV96DRAFT_638842, partial [Lophiotrema nucula]